MQNYNYKNRNEVPEKYKCDLSSLFKNEEEFNECLLETQKEISELKKFKGCTKDSVLLFEFLKEETKVIAKLDNLYTYASLMNDVLLGNSANIERKNKVEILNSEFTLNTCFFVPELLKLSKKEYQSLFNNNPRLKEFKAELDDTYRYKEYALSESEEKILSDLVLATDHYEDISSTLLDNVHNYGKIKLQNGESVIITSNNYRTLLKNKDKIIRKKIYNSYNKTLDQYGAISAGLLNNYISMNNSLSKSHHYKNSWDEKLFNYNLSDKVFITLVDTIESNLKILQKFYQLKRKILNLDTLHSYDLYLEKITIESLKVLGNEYSLKLKKVFNDRHIDYCSYKGKWSGGYCTSPINNSSRILMSYTNDLKSISTIVHESGHDVHSQFINEFNPLHYRFPQTIVCEVASLVNECLLSYYIAENGKTKDERLSGIYNILSVIASNLFDAVREGKNEQDMYERVFSGDYLTKDYLDNLTYKSLEKYYGDSLKLDKYSKNSWITRSHYFNNFYLYSYAICISVASNVASKILSGDTKMLNKYIEFLKQGSDKCPKEAFAVLGINLEDKSVYENVIKYFDSLISKYYEILEKEE